MRFTSSVIASAALLSTANAAIKGFNYGAQFNNDAAKQLADFEYEFNRAKNLPGTDGWTSARLYTMIQHGTQNTVIEAIQAAVNTKTRLLLGLWASAGQESFNNEIAALKAAIAQYGTAFTDLVDGISIGSEDLYRVSPDGAGGNPGAGPDVLVNYIQQVRNAIAGTSLSGAKLGHVDTWQVYVDAGNNAVIDALDWIGMDAYPYFQSSFANSVGNGGDLFFDAYNKTKAATKGKPVWVTETGWPVSGETVNQAVPSADNARVYWEDVACKLVNDNVNLYYYILQDVQWGNPSPSFGIMPGGDLAQVSPLFDLSCPGAAKNVSYFPIVLLSSTLSPLLVAVLAHLSLAAAVLYYFLPTAPAACNHFSSKHMPVHSLASTAKPSGWVARADVNAKWTLSLPTMNSSSSVNAASNLSSLGVNSPSTTEPIDVTAPGFPSDNSPSSKLAPAPGSHPAIEPLLRFSNPPLGLQGPFEAPNLIIPIDKANPSQVIGNGYIAQLSPTLSSIFVFDIRPEDEGKTCNLEFHMPPVSPWPDMSPVKLRSPGGITVSSVGQQAASAGISANDVANSTIVGSVPSVQPANRYSIAGVPCAAGQRVAYQLDSTGGLEMDFFQMTTPALGLFMSVS